MSRLNNVKIIIKLLENEHDKINNLINYLFNLLEYN